MTLDKKERAYVDSAYLKLQGDINKFADFLGKTMKGREDKAKVILLTLLLYF